ncbi:dTDP-4-dehydrorhamnose 3,5-epimerase [Aliiroseovarius sediminis]|uniref:dTDP-4-dehydrorhamnose 3,5-epimerase n=1 Tax=Aliiroseovarius sediminis TaxID=2925839 RepID=UPI001F568408|nr:dTDP-4-dehydrorhamnose 3,5-epimerase [uncultured Aliiroseovarius sp.]MCI2395744.1 dTDP-4-dehydrorhamnose 3,5-epimerase [Aliiroseovarius sediminis]
MKVEQTKLEGVVIVTPARHGDNRGFFSETFSTRAMAQAGLPSEFVQDNLSRSANKGTVRGLHCQAPPHAQAKLVRCLRGAILDVAVDVRHGSDTYGEWVAVELSDDNGAALLVPEGYLHGFITLTDGVDVFYKCSDHYAPETEMSVRFDDPDIGIDWGMPSDEATLSAKDREAGRLADFVTPFDLGGGPRDA